MCLSVPVRVLMKVFSFCIAVFTLWAHSIFQLQWWNMLLTMTVTIKGNKRETVREEFNKSLVKSINLKGLFVCLTHHCSQPFCLLLEWNHFFKLPESRLQTWNCIYDSNISNAMQIAHRHFFVIFQHKIVKKNKEKVQRKRAIIIMSSDNLSWIGNKCEVL